MPTPEPSNSPTRQWLNKRSALATLVALAVIVVCLFFIYLSVRPAPDVTTYNYYYDLSTNSLFVDTADKVAPFQIPTAKDGSRGSTIAVQAIVFSCTDCNDPTKRFIGYLQQYTPEARAIVVEYHAKNQLIDSQNLQADPRNSGFVIRAPEGELWYPPDSMEGDLIMREARQRCGGRGAFPSLCFPTSPNMQ